MRYLVSALVGGAVVFAFTYSSGSDPVRVERERSAASQPNRLRAGDEPVPGASDPNGASNRTASPSGKN